MKKFLILLICLFSLNSYSQFHLANLNAEPHTIATNNELVEKILDEFFDSAKYYKVDFVPGLLNLKVVKLVPGDMKFLGSNENGEILLNDKLIYYPNLMRWVLFNQLGQHYGLELERSDLRIIMSKNLELSSRFEFYGESLRVRGTQKRIFFEKLEKHLPLTLRI